MIICGSYMFEFSVSNNMKNKLTMIKKRISANPLAYLLTLIINELKISEQGRMVTTLNIIKP